jgi:riboflavin synthase
MFTGLVQAVGTVRNLERRPKGVRLTIDAGSWKYRPSQGDSVSVSGCCLTVTAAGVPKAKGKSRSARGGANLFAFDVIQETLNKTMLGGLRVGSRVNLEHAATPTTLMGGHIVQGHVDGVGEVVRVQRGEDWRVWVAIPRTASDQDDLYQYLTPKGSVCIDGVSMTIASIWSDKRSRGFSLALIPTTLTNTTLGDLQPGDAANLEMDVIAKTVIHWLGEFGAGGAGGGGSATKRKARSEKRK